MLIEHDTSGLNYMFPVERLKWGHAYGNSHAYVTLDGKTDLTGDRGDVRHGLRESTNQHYYLLGWEVSVVSSDGRPFVPASTTFAPAYQQSELTLEGQLIRKRFFLPFESSYLRSAHFLLDTTNASGELMIRSRAVFPAGVDIEKADYGGQQYLTAKFPDGTIAVLWGSQSLQSLESRVADDQSVEVLMEWMWQPDSDEPEYGLSFAYSLGGREARLGGARAPLGVLFDLYSPDAPSPRSHLYRVNLLLAEATAAINRYLNTGQLCTPDPLINRAVQWAKLNQLRDQQEYRRGVGFSNHPPSDIVVGRDSVWYLAGSNYYAQPWSRKLLDFWFRYGMDVNGKFTEYLTAAHEPMYKDDYGLNINDNTPLFLIAAHQYYSLTGDQGFLHAVYPSLVTTASYILEQRQVGENNHFNLVWCTSTETFVRGLCSWRNCIRDYNLSGAVTEVNTECYQALLLMAELAQAVGDELNRDRFEAAANDLRDSIEQHLRSQTASNGFYYLNIDPAGRPVDDVTADLLFPVLCGVADDATSERILRELFSEHFWATTDGEAGGIRSVSAVEEGYRPIADPDSYGLLGGVWPNLALWTAKAAADRGFADLSLKALRGTYLLSERDDPAGYNVTPGEFPEYFNGNDLVQRGMPRSTFIPGIFIWATFEGLLGLSPHPAGLVVNPALPEGWDWAAVGRIPYRGYPLSLLAVRKEQTIYATARVESRWKQVVVPDALQQRFTCESDGQPFFWIVVPDGEGYAVLAASDEATTGRLVDRKTRRVVAELSILAGGLIRERLL